MEGLGRGLEIGKEFNDRTNTAMPYNVRAAGAEILRADEVVKGVRKLVRKDDLVVQTNDHVCLMRITPLRGPNGPEPIRPHRTGP